jgi:hypothetical protein
MRHIIVSHKTYLRHYQTFRDSGRCARHHFDHEINSKKYKPVRLHENALGICTMQTKYTKNTKYVNLPNVTVNCVGCKSQVVGVRNSQSALCEIG